MLTLNDYGIILNLIEIEKERISLLMVGRIKDASGYLRDINDLTNRVKDTIKKMIKE